MKILQVIASVDPAGGGPIEGIRQLGTILTANGHQVEVASLDSPGAPYLSQGRLLPVHPLGPTVLDYRFSSRLVPWLRAHRTQYDAVIVNGIWQFHSFGTWRALRDSDTPYVLYTHGMLDPWFRRRYPLKHLKKWMYWPWAEYRVLRDAQAVLFTCEEERLLARSSFRLYRCKEVVVGYGVAKPDGDPEFDLQGFFRMYPELCGRRLALFMGRIHPKKGCDLLIEAFAEVLASDPEWRLVIAGPDQVGWQTKLDQLARRLGVDSRITWTGMINGPLKWGAIRGAEVFVLPSHQENFGMVVAEALAAGVPALISHQVNIWREIEADGAGIVAEDTLQGTCHLLRSYLGLSREKNIAMRESARRCFQQRFEVSQAADRLQAVLDHVVGLN